jgi:hypothetical protein
MVVGYSHADRIGGDMSLLDPKRIQETVCSGRDIFNMLPEVRHLFFHARLSQLTSRAGIHGKCAAFGLDVPTLTILPAQYKEMFELMHPEP